VEAGVPVTVNGKQWLLTGGGAWNQYAEEYTTFDEAKRAAVYWLDLGYDAHVVNLKTNEAVELTYRYDGLGHA
jgi:hypothetical protein